MSNKSINESIREAWQKSLQNGDVIRSIKQKEKAQIDSIVENTRNNVLSHIAESDKGFYRPETSPHHKFRDGEYIRRQRLMEQQAIPGSTSTDAGLSQDVDAERRKREREKRQQEQEQQGRRREEVAAQAASARPSRATDPRRTGTRGSTDGGGFDPSQRNPDDIRNPGRDRAVDDIIASTKDETPIMVPDLLARPEDQSPRDPLAGTMIGKPEEKTPGEFVLRPDEKKPEEVETVGDYRRTQLNKMSDRELSKQVDTQAGKNFDSDISAIEAEQAEKEGLSVDEYKARTKKRQGKMKEFDKGEGKELKREIENLEAKAKAARRAGNREESIELYRQASQLRRDAAAGRSEFARAGEDAPATTATDADATDTATDTAAAGGAGGEDGSAVEVTGGPVSTDTVQHGGVVEPKDEPELTVDDIKDTKIDPETGREIVHAAPTRLGGEGGYDISGALSTEIDLDKFGMPDNPDLKLKGTVHSQMRKDGAGYKQMTMDPTDTSGVEYIRNYQDGRKEIRYRTGRVNTLDAQGNEIQAGEEGAFNPQIERQKRKILSDSDLGPKLAELEQDIAAFKDSSGSASRQADVNKAFSYGYSGVQGGRETASSLNQRKAKIISSIAKKLNIGEDQAEEMFREKLGLPAKTDAEKQAAATQAGDDVKPDPVTGANAPTNAPPASVAGQPPTSPPPPATAAEEEEEELVGPPQPVTSSYNPINKYGINLFEAKGPLQR